jgi:UDP-N-acetyl-D-galactosamine dehydrogenase
MGAYVVGQVVKLMIQKSIPVSDSRVLIMGLTFKEDCPDLRNTRVVDMVDEFKGYGVSPDVHDPWIDADEAYREYGITPVAKLDEGEYDAIIMAVAHRQFREMGIESVRALGRPNHILYDIKYIFSADQVDGRL